MFSDQFDINVIINDGNGEYISIERYLAYYEDLHKGIKEYLDTFEQIPQKGLYLSCTDEWDAVAIIGVSYYTSTKSIFIEFKLNYIP